MKRLLGFLIFVATCGFAFSNKQKLAVDVQNVDPDATVDVIVQYRTPPTEANYNKVARRGGVLKRSLEIVNGAHYSVQARVLDELTSDPDVVYITPDRPVQATLDYANPTVN